MTAVLEPTTAVPTTGVDDAPLAGDRLADGLLAAHEVDDPFTDDELAELALGADPEPSLDGARPWTPAGTALMPDWYMSPGMPRRRRGWRRVVALAVVVGLVAINAAGLCITYGHLVIA
jgi:hypothetical protein